MAAALQIWSPTFSRAFDNLPPAVRTDVERKVDEMGTRLEWNPLVSPITRNKPVFVKKFGNRFRVRKQGRKGKK